MQIRILTILLSLAAEAILATVFFVLIPPETLPADIRWLDFGVMTVVNIVYVLNIFFPFVDTTDRSHKEVGALGIRWASTGLYTSLAFLFMLGNIIYASQNFSRAMSFGLQATIQAALLLFFFCGIVASTAAMEKTKEVYMREKIVKAGKADIRAAVAQVLAVAEDAPDIPGELTDRIRRISSDTRYISPTVSPESMKADKNIISDCDALEASLTDYKINREQVESQLARLERDLHRRKSLTDRT